MILHRTGCVIRTHSENGSFTCSEPFKRFSEAYARLREMEAADATLNATVVNHFTEAGGKTFAEGKETLSSGNEIECPHCGHEMEDLHEYRLGDEDSTEDECGNCGNPFTISASISIDYTATALVPTNNPGGAS